MAQNIFFYLIAAVMVFSAIRVVTTSNVVHAALYLVGVLAGAAAQFLLLSQEFVATTQVLVYIGAIIVLFLFGIMLTRARVGHDPDLTNSYWYVGAAVSVFLFGLLAYVLVDAYAWSESPMGGETQESFVGTNTQQVSDSIFSTYLVPFEVISVLLLAALVGAIVLARKE
jgi:NADH-quinone oxidoreductase subunit J